MAVLFATPVVVAVLISCSVVYVVSDSTGTPNAIPKNVQDRFVKPSIEPVPPSVVPEQATILSNESLPNNTNYMPEVGNGHIATVIHGNSVFMNGLYNGGNVWSHRARIPSFSGYSINATTPSDLKRLYSLDVGRGVFFESYTGHGVNITLRTYAHRELTRVLVTELVLSRDDISKDVHVTINLNLGPPSPDVDLTNDTSGVKHGLTKQVEFPELANRTGFYILTSASLEGKLVLTPGRKLETYLALTAIDVDKQMVINEYNLAVAAFESNSLLKSHVTHWNNRWQKASIDVEGDLYISKINYACLYYLLSSLPWVPNNKNWPFIGLSPGGLAHGGFFKDYFGHLFWDQDTWMFPSIALLHPDLGRKIVETRTKTLEASKLYAKRSGLDGARYAWESAFTGLETCGGPAKVEVHISGDVCLMVRQYWQLTHDQDLMINGAGAEVVWEIAKFWASRVTYKEEDDTYRILDVMPPDEYHFPINDSIYTNTIAKINLNFANDLKRIFRLPENATWSTISKKLYLLYDDKLDYHPEFEGYSPSELIKQADVVLLSYPLMVEMNDSTRANDLRIYERKTPNGPAPGMTWGMHALNWLELGNETKAADLFTRSLLNVHQPFYAWSEFSNGNGAVNFHTGMGGYLQSVLFGYGGIRLYDDTMRFNPKLIKGTTKIKFNGISYRGCTLNLEYTSDYLNLTLTSVNSGSKGLDVKFEEKDQWHNMVGGLNLLRNRQLFYIRSSQ